MDRFFASGSPEGSSSCSNGGSGGYKARDARAGGGAALTPVVKRRAILYDRSPQRHDHDTSFPDTQATAAAASALLAVRSSEGPRRYDGPRYQQTSVFALFDGYMFLYIRGRNTCSLLTSISITEPISSAISFGMTSTRVRTENASDGSIFPLYAGVQCFGRIETEAMLDS